MTWEELVEEEGYIGIWRRLLHLQSFKDYYRRWPYDDCSRLLHLHGGDYIDEQAEQKLREIEDRYDLDCKMSAWTPRQRMIAEYVIAGYKPREIAKLLGERNSGAIRWVKWNLRKKVLAL